MGPEVACCPLCGSDRNVPFDRRLFMNVPVNNRLCESCGLVFQSPRLSKAEADEFHRTQYRRIHQVGNASIDPREIAIQRARADCMLALFSKTVAHVSSHLDIGCSAGLLMQAFAKAYSCKTTGLELDNLYRSYALQQGLQVFETLEALPQPGRFDVISMSHVLEHIPEPVEFLKRLRQDFLEPAGWLFLEVPNLYAHDCFEPGHLISFSSHTLAQVLQQAGFRVIRSVHHGLPRSKIVPLYLNVLAQPGGEEGGPVKRESMVLPRRKIGRGLRRLAEYFFPAAAKLSIIE